MYTNATTPSCPIFPLKPEHCIVMTYTKNVASAMSIVGSLLVLFLIWILRKYKAFTQRLIAHVSVASLGHPTAYILHTAGDGPSWMCTVQGVLTTFFDDAISFWVCFVAINLYAVVFHTSTLQRYERQITVTCWTVPAILAVLPFIGGAEMYGPAHIWCWITNIWAWRLGIVYLWRLLSVGVMLVLICRIVYRLFIYSRTQREDGRVGRHVENDIRILRLYPVVYLLINVFSIVNRVQNAIRPADPVFGLYVIQSITDPSFGFVAAMVFVLDKKTKQVLTPRKMRDLIRQRRTGGNAPRSYHVGDA